MNRIAIVLLLLSAAPASGQLTAAKTHPVAMGHHHFLVEDVAEKPIVSGLWINTSVQPKWRATCMMTGTRST